MKHEQMTLWIAVLALILGGCSTYPKKVDCEGHLKPINAPAPADHTGSAS
jgi:starvation-inducible outer membrane lipoprotein